MIVDRARGYEKANAYSQAWASIYGTPPSTAHVALALSVAEHETRCGDAWPGHNWGACTKGAPSPAQRAALQAAGIYAVLSPTSSRIASEEAAMAALQAAGLAPLDDQELHVDSSPHAGPYFTFFGKFADDEAGARYFIHVLAEQRSSCAAILVRGGSPYELAGAMYRSRYYTGFHDPHVEGGDEANVADYAASLARLQPTILAALKGWSPGAEPPVYQEPAGPPDLGTNDGIQTALNVLGATPPLDLDGVLGPKSIAAIQQFQKLHGLAIDGHVGAATVRALRDALNSPR